MNLLFNIENFISERIIYRNESILSYDLLSNQEKLFAGIKDKSALVIGGAGTIGSSFIKALLNYKPARLYIVDINENELTELTRDLRSSLNLTVPKIFKTYPINFKDPVFYKLLQKEGPFDIIANFAAHKHVRSEKDHYSILALLDNNVIQAEKLLNSLLKLNVEHFFCVSTDKAANPVNVMGASKKIMEEVLMAYAKYLPITTARFANVAFSNGSLLDGFIKRLAKRQPLSAPDDVKRYFVSPIEAGQICLLSCILGKSGEIFFPKLSSSQMMTFSEIAIQLLSSLGLEPLICASEHEAKDKTNIIGLGEHKYPVYFFKSETSGEKTTEEFYTSDEKIDLNSYLSLGIIKNSTAKSMEEVDYMIKSLSFILNDASANKKNIVALLEAFLPNFHHIETGMNLDQKM